MSHLPAVVIPRQSLRAVVLDEFIVVPPQALSALWLDYAGDDYWANGTEYALLSSVPGYTFTRTGQQGAIDSDGTVDWFAADVPAVNGAGYHAFGALTNVILQSQDFATTWTARGVCPVTPNTHTAPDGTLTADTLALPADSNGGREQGGVAGAGTSNTLSIFAKVASGTKSFTLQSYNGVTVISSGIFTATTDWQRFVFHVTHNNPAQIIIMSDGIAGDLIVWQAQMIAGDFPDGGPLIATAGATASIGASDLRLTDATSDVDQLFMARLQVPAGRSGNADSVHPRLAQWGATNNLAFWFGGFTTQPGWFGDTTTLFNITLGSDLAADAEAVLVARRLGGQWRAGHVIGGALTWWAAASTVAWTNPSSLLCIGTGGGANICDFPIDGVFRREGDFSTDQSIIDAAAEVA